MLKRVVATGAGLVLACAAVAACGSETADSSALTDSGASAAVTGSQPATPSASTGVGVGAGADAGPTLQKLGAAIYTTSAPASKPPAAADTESATSANPAGWGDPVAVENFDGPLSSTWGKYDSPDSDPPRSEDQVSVSGGMMHLTGSVNSKLGKDVGAGVSYNKNLKYGRWEVRWRVDAGAGYGPVILLWPKNNEDWPTYGEIDFMEMSDPTRQEYGTYIHHGSDNNQIGHEFVKGDFTQWHTAAVDWLPDRVTYYLDGKKVWNVTPGMLKTGLPTESVMHLGIQLDQGCDEYMGCRNAQTPDKVVMDIDWVKVYQAP